MGQDLPTKGRFSVPLTVASGELATELQTRFPLVSTAKIMRFALEKGLREMVTTMPTLLPAEIARSFRGEP